MEPGKITLISYKNTSLVSRSLSENRLIYCGQASLSQTCPRYDRYSRTGS